MARIIPVCRTSATAGWVANGRPGGHLRRSGAVAGEHAVALEDVQRGQRRRAGQRVATVAVRMQEGAVARVVEEAVVTPGGEHRAQWEEAAGQAFDRQQQVGLDTAARSLLAGEQGAGAAEADRDLVGDQQHAVGVAQLAHAAQVAGWCMRMPPAHCTSEHQDHGADFARVACRGRSARRPPPQHPGLGHRGSATVHPATV